MAALIFSLALRSARFWVPPRANCLLLHHSSSGKTLLLSSCRRPPGLSALNALLFGVETELFPRLPWDNLNCFLICLGTIVPNGDTQRAGCWRWFPCPISRAAPCPSRAGGLEKPAATPGSGLCRAAPFLPAPAGAVDPPQPLGPVLLRALVPGWGGDAENWAGFFFISERGGKDEARVCSNLSEGNEVAIPKG